RLYEKLGAHLVDLNDFQGAYFAVWAPNAERVAVVGDFNGWSEKANYLQPRGSSGIWEGFIPGIQKGALYKFHITSRYGGYQVQKSDPFALHTEMPPRTASILWDLEYEWNDQEWMAKRAERNGLDRPISIYEVHIGSWMYMAEENRPLTYRELAPRLTEYVQRLGFTHVEFLPIMEHPFG